MSYCEIPEFFHETKQRAQKSYVCCECNHLILKGEIYWKSSGKWDGKIEVLRQHPWCRAACTHLSSFDYDSGCIAFGAMFDAWGEIYHRKRPEYKKLRTYLAKVYRQMRNPLRQQPPQRAGGSDG